MSTTEHFATALQEFLKAREKKMIANAEGLPHAKIAAQNAEDHALARLEDAFNAAVDERVQQALAYDRQP